jgi:phage shock protein A
MEVLQDQVAQLSGALNAMITKNGELERAVHSLNNQVQNRNPPPNNVDLFKIPDPIKMIPTYSGNRNQLNNWLKTAEDTLDIFEQVVPQRQFKIYLQAVINKLEGKARDVLCLAGDIENFDSVKDVLLEALGDKQELSTYKSQLWQNRMTEEMTIHKYYSTTKELVQKIKTLSKQKELYKTNWEAISEFIEEDALAAFISGLKKPYFGYASAARPKSLEEAYAFLCKFTSNEKTSSGMFKRTSSNDTKKPFQKKTDQSNSEPMEIDPSLRSKLSSSKKYINTHELQEEEDSDDEVPDTEAADISINFWEAQDSAQKG